MTLYSVFKQMGYELPLKVENGNVTESLKLFLDIYYNQLNSLSSLGYENREIYYANHFSLPNDVYKLSLNLVSIINQSTPNNFAQSYQAFVQSSQTYNVFAYLKTIPQIKKIPIGTSFYRVRPLKKGEKSFGREGVFHKPFEIKDSVGNFRYSVKHTPALYLSTSLPLALQETRLNALPYAAIRFETTHEINVINVDYSYFLYHRFEEVMKEEPSIFLFLGMILPIVAACSIKVPIEHEDRDFKEEYIIPQLLMRFVQEYRNEYQGIRFYSSRIDLADYQQHRNQYNLVLPTKVTATSGYDNELKKLFIMTDIKNVTVQSKPNEIELALQQMKAYKIDF